MRRLAHPERVAWLDALRQAAPFAEAEPATTLAARVRKNSSHPWGLFLEGHADHRSALRSAIRAAAALLD